MSNPYEYSGSAEKASKVRRTRTQVAPGWLGATAILTAAAIVVSVIQVSRLLKFSSSTIVLFALFGVATTGFGLVAASYLIRNRIVYLAGAICSLGGISLVLFFMFAWWFGFDPLGLE